MADYSGAYMGTPAPTWEQVDDAFRRGYDKGYAAGYKEGLAEAKLQSIRDQVSTASKAAHTPRCPKCQWLMFDDEGQEHVCRA